MYLKKAEFLGFKSFATKTELRFTPGITAVVGPNGSGKSNIVDAIRWVLGEQSLKTLRGSRLEEVIFAGTNERSPLGLAQVSLTLDNGDGSLPLSYSEVKVSRKVFRSGESEYEINKNPCRLRDIQELFMDTGLGKDAYSLVSQGEINLVLSSKPEELRFLLEEAAGVSKFKYRKKEALRKLEVTRENLLRLDDIVREVSSQLQPLREQAERAKEYQRISSRLKDLEVSIIAKEIKDKQENLGKIKGEIKTLKERVQGLEEEERAKEGEKELKRKELGAKEDNLMEKQKRQEVLSQQEQEVRTKAAVGEERIKTIREQREREDEEIKRAGEELSTSTSQLKELKEEREDLLLLIKKKEVELKEKIKEREEVEEKIRSLSEEEEIKKAEVIEGVRELSNLHNQLSFLQAKNKEKEKRERKEKEEVNLKKEEREKTREELSLLKFKLKELERESKEEELRLKTLRQFEGYSEGVKNILGEQKNNPSLFPNICGVIACLLKVPEDLRIAVEVALNAHWQDLIVEDEEEAEKIISYLKTNQKGRATFFPLALLRDKEPLFDFTSLYGPGVKGLALDLVEFDPKYEKVIKYLLGNVLVVDNLSTARAKFKSLDNLSSPSVKIVTLSGDLIDSSGTITGGSTQRRISIGMKEGELILDEEERLKEDLRKKEMQRASLGKDLEVFIKEEESKTKELDILSKELSLEEKERKEMLEEEKRLERELKDLTIKDTSLNSSLNTLSDNLATFRSRREETSLLITSLKVDLAGAKERMESREGRIRERKERGEELNKRIKVETEERKKRDLDEKELECNLKDLVKLEEEEGRKKKEIEGEIDKAKEEQAALREEIGRIEEELKEKGKKKSRELEEEHTLEIEEAKKEAERDELSSRLKQNYNLSFEEAEAHLGKIEDWDRVLAQVERYKNKLSSLGSVNLIAREEYERQSQRFNFLVEQQEDLKKGRDSLNKVIREIDRDTKKAFLKTFQEIESNFSQIFKSLFGGGEAGLILVEPDNLLETGVEIEVQLPKKKRQNLLLLSGGEKSLTAIAFLFAILKTKPSPFCILDEVDVALDEANVEKFANLLLEFVKDSQFIVITHSKGTMEVADVLYGVTMEEAGVSKLVSLKLAERET